MKDPNSPSWLQDAKGIPHDDVRGGEQRSPRRVMVGVLRSVWRISDDRGPPFMRVRTRIPCIGEVIRLQGRSKIERLIIRAEAERLIIANSSRAYVQNWRLERLTDEDKLASLSEKTSWVRAVESEP